MREQELTPRQNKYQENLLKNNTAFKEKLISMGFVPSTTKKVVKNIISGDMKAPKRVKTNHLLQESYTFAYEGLIVVIHTGISNNAFIKNAGGWIHITNGPDRLMTRNFKRNLSYFDKIIAFAVYMQNLITDIPLCPQCSNRMQIIKISKTENLLRCNRSELHQNKKPIENKYYFTEHIRTLPEKYHDIVSDKEYSRGLFFNDPSYTPPKHGRKTWNIGEKQNVK